jgi:DNA polymerase
MFEAHNSFFEWCVWVNVMVPRYGWPPLDYRQILCSAARSAVACLPRSLEFAAFHAGCENQKGDDTAMKKLSKPRKPTKNDPREWFDDPGLFDALYDYCDQDVITERELSDRIPALSKRERRVFLADMLINLRGLRIDVDFVKASIKVNTIIDREISAELSSLTKGYVTTAGQRDRILKWLDDSGLEMLNLTKEVVEDTLYERELTKKQRRVLVLRQEGSRSSVSKFRAFEEWCDGDVVRGLYIYYGANAHGRFSGKGPQPQNLPRGDAKCKDPKVKGGDAMEAMVADVKRSAKDGDVDRLRRNFRIEESETFGDPRSARRMVPAPPAEVLSTAIRGAFVAREGRAYGVGDYSAIEARKVFWFAGEERGLKILASGGDIYRDQASDIFDKPPDELDVGFERMMGKTVVLGCGYGMGWKKFKLTCKRAYGMVIDDELCKKSVYSYRSRYEKVPIFWDALDKAARRCIQTGRQIEVSMLTFWMDDGDMKIRLPSGRDIVMRSARISRGDQITFLNGKGYIESTYGGKICEYVCSGSARDVLADAIVMAEFDYDNVDPVMHSHDELVCEGEPGKVGEIVGEIMLKAAGANCYKGLPTKIETWEGARYHK